MLYLLAMYLQTITYFTRIGLGGGEETGCRAATNSKTFFFFTNNGIFQIFEARFVII